MEHLKNLRKFYRNRHVDIIEQYIKDDNKQDTNFKIRFNKSLRSIKKTR